MASSAPTAARARAARARRPRGGEWRLLALNALGTVLGFALFIALALGGVLRVNQVQLLQPFIVLVAAVPLPGERLEPLTLVCALAVAAVVFVGRRQTPAGGAERRSARSLRASPRARAGSAACARG